MRLLDVDTLGFLEFLGDSIPPYAILSHTWEADELTYQDMLTQNEIVKEKDGYRKLEGFIKKAKKHKYKHAWIDTCCINKESSAELSEAINSMYMWYKNSAICIVYLSDCAIQDGEVHYLSENGLNSHPEFEKSRWFKRGWTLQELIAPKKLRFYSNEWRTLHVPSKLLSHITQIPIRVIESGVMDGISVAQRMCWASKRETTRVEDIAYCLLGIFDVNMPLLYGEGEKAFTRLQEEIIRRTNDQTIFLWKVNNAHEKVYRGILARHPIEFSNCATIQEYEGLPEVARPYNLTNMGIQMSLSLLPFKSTAFMEYGLEFEDLSELYVPILHCWSGSQRSRIQSVVLRRLSKSGQHFVRVMPNIIIDVDLMMILGEPTGKPTKLQDIGWPEAQQLYIRQQIRVSDLFRNQVLPSGFLIDTRSGVEVPLDDGRWNEPFHVHDPDVNLSSWTDDILEPLASTAGRAAVCVVHYAMQSSSKRDLLLVVGLDSVDTLSLGQLVLWFGFYDILSAANYQALNGQTYLTNRSRDGKFQLNYTYRLPARLCSMVMHRDRFLARITIDGRILPGRSISRAE